MKFLKNPSRACIEPERDEWLASRERDTASEMGLKFFDTSQLFYLDFMMISPILLGIQRKVKIYLINFSDEKDGFFRRIKSTSGHIFYNPSSKSTIQLIGKDFLTRDVLHHTIGIYKG